MKNFLKRIPGLHITPEKKTRMIYLFNRYSILFHAILSMALCFAIEVISRHSMGKAFGFLALHTWAFINLLSSCHIL